MLPTGLVKVELAGQVCRGPPVPFSPVLLPQCVTRQE